MIHINSTKTSSMFNRRPRSLIHTCIIVLLVIIVVYVAYLNSNLQVQVKNLDSKSKLYQAQHQSLSSQLQVVYEERSRLETSLQKEKAEHQNSRSELEQEKISHERIQSDIEKEHQQKYDNLIAVHANVKDELDRVNDQLANVKDEKENLERQQSENISDLQAQKEKHQQIKNDHEKLQENYQKLSDEKIHLESQYREQNTYLARAQTEMQNYQKLKSVLLDAGSDVLKLDHSRLDSMGKENRLLLFAHMAGSPLHAEQLEENRLLLNRDQAQRQAALEYQARQKAERDRLLAAKNLQSITSPCMLPAEPGSCTDQITRFYYNPQISSCTLFTYSGCGGNQNNFATFEKCNAVCGDGRQEEAPSKPQMAGGEEMLNPRYPETLRGQVGQAQPVQSKNGLLPQEPAIINKIVENENEHQKDELEPTEMDPNRFFKKSPDESDENTDIDEKNPDDETNSEENDPLDLMEQKARKEEEQARQEILKQQQAIDEPPSKVSEEEAIKKIQELQAEQQHVAQEQAQDVEKLIQQKLGQSLKDENFGIEGEIQDADESESESENEEEKEDLANQDYEEEQFGLDSEKKNAEVQVNEPPAGVRVEDGQKNVIDAPVHNKFNEVEADELHNKGEDEYEEYEDEDEKDEDGLGYDTGEREGQEEEEEEEYNP
ncbi:uncharacterized protein LOC143448870 [Clavelina lepadiformis]|uniref:uncharacterized protein LOC143448870 n=1 Tax=Clavelina lepadiformis TaxID=159417 RepID=UPI004040FA1B